MLLTPVFSPVVSGGTVSVITHDAHVTGDGAGSTSESVSINTGTAQSGDKLVIGVSHGLWGGGGSAISGMTVGGETASGPVVAQHDSSSNEYAEIWYIDDADGSLGGTETVAMTFGSAQSVIKVSVWRCEGLATGTAATNATSNGSATVATLSLNVSDGDLAFGVAVTRDDDDTNQTWIGLTEDFEEFIFTDYDATSASDRMTSAETPRTVTATFSSAGNRNVAGVSAAFSQA